MLLSKKETAKPFLAMYYAGVLNIFVSYVNLLLYTQNGSLVSLVCTCISLSAAIVVFLIIKRKTQEILWDKLTKKDVPFNGLDLG